MLLLGAHVSTVLGTHAAALIRYIFIHSSLAISSKTKAFAIGESQSENASQKNFVRNFIHYYKL